MEIPVDGNGSQKKDSDFLKGRRAQPSDVYIQYCEYVLCTVVIEQEHWIQPEK